MHNPVAGAAVYGFLTSVVAIHIPANTATSPTTRLGVIGSPTTLQELRVECFFPMDDEGQHAARLALSVVELRRHLLAVALRLVVIDP